jgi:hypothetical protein
LHDNFEQESKKVQSLREKAESILKETKKAAQALQDIKNNGEKKAAETTTALKRIVDLRTMIENRTVKIASTDATSANKTRWARENKSNEEELEMIPKQYFEPDSNASIHVKRLYSKSISFMTDYEKDVKDSAAIVATFKEAYLAANALYSKASSESSHRPLLKLFEFFMKKKGCDRQAHFKQAVTGNHCNAMFNHHDEILNEFLRLCLDTLRRRKKPGKSDQEVKDMVANMKLLCISCKNIGEQIADPRKQLDDAACDLLERTCVQYGQRWRAVMPKSARPAKLHLTETELPIIMRLTRNVMRHEEGGVERWHRLFNAYLRSFSPIRNWETKVNAIIKRHDRNSHPLVLIAGEAMTTETARKFSASTLAKRKNEEEDEDKVKKEKWSEDL